MALKHEPTASYHSVQDALRVLETVARRDTGVNDTELARETGITTERLTTLLRMLRREAYVEQIADGAYVTGAAFTRLCSVGAAVYITRYVDGEVEVTQYADGPATPKVNEWVDFRSSAHATAMGKSLLTQLDHDGRRDHLARHRMARLTSRTITSDRLLLSRLASQPPTVPVLDLQEYAVGTVCAAVPVTAGSSVGCLALSLPVEHAHRLRRAADALNRNAAPVLLSLTI
ncbi:IclR family transcriptional regulator C-terminal domain-containing protein [Streptomyces sp. NPDC058726]|uniref:IclR family transcriptional regulator domain-containing protein n=1 Tax=Streptomyces sp. NPDC058726 TaxID=3346611 RepID=UPI00369A9CB7